AKVLVVGRQRELLAQARGRLVDRETRPDRRNLEQDAARLAEVDRLEVEAVDHRRRVRAGLDHPLAPILVCLRLAGPGDVVDGARALDAGFGRRFVVGVHGAALLAADLPVRLSAW